MIHAVRADRTSFKQVGFEPGFNVVLAERTQEATRRDSRNGLGKSTLIEIVHFCLGASTTKNQGLCSAPLLGWTFSLDIDLHGRRYTASRSTETPGRVYVEGDCSTWPLQPRRDLLTSDQSFSLKEWNQVLGYLMFGLPPANDDTRAPTFRSLISYFIRRSRDAFSIPFEHHRKQMEWDKQVNNAFLLGLSWRHAAQWQILREQDRALASLRDAARSGFMANIIGSLGELETRKVQLESQLERSREQLATFKVHPQYREVEERADRFTSRIHQLINDNVSDRRMVTFYETSLEEEAPPMPDGVASLYAEAGVVLPDQVVRRLADVQQFHQRIISNRRGFLAGEMSRLRTQVSEREEEARRLTEQRAELMMVLQSHGALDEYVRLQERNSQLAAQLEELKSRIEDLRRFEAGKSALRIEQEQLLQAARADFDERRGTRDREIALFNANSEALYESPGSLIIDVGQTGLRFDVKIERSASQGIEQMKVFCYDTMLAQLWARREFSPGFLIHDSTIFDGVDERQVARALELAAAAADESGFQYICCLNSDAVPWPEFEPGFDLRGFKRLELTDADEDGGLLGIRF